MKSIMGISCINCTRSISCFLFEFTINCSYVYITHAEGTNQVWNSPGNKTIESISYQMNASECFSVSSHLWILKSTQDNIMFQQSFERIIGLFSTLSFLRSQLINIHEKDNWIVWIIKVQLYPVSNYWSLWLGNMIDLHSGFTCALGALNSL